MDTISKAFLNHASDSLARGLSGSEIVRITSAHAADYGVELPHPTYPFVAPNKRTALFENLVPFSPQQQYEILREMTDRVMYWSAAQESEKESATQIKLKLHSQYGHLSNALESAGVDQSLKNRTRHILESYPDVKKLFDAALSKSNSQSYTRNALDDMRLALELLLKNLLQNNKSLENQIASVGLFISQHGGSPEFANMFVKLIDYYSKYQNTYVKHNDAVPFPEVEFIFDMTASFMKHFVQLKGSDGTN